MRVTGVEQHQRESAEFYEAARDECLGIVLISVGNRPLAEDLVADAFTKACQIQAAWEFVPDSAPISCW